MADTSLTWIQKHERVVICLFVIIPVLYLGNRYFDGQSAAADARNQAAQQVLQAQKEANAQTAQQVQAAQAQYQVLVGQMNDQNARLTAQITTLSQALAARQKQDAALPLPDLALRQKALLNISSGVTATPTGLLVSPSASVQTVQALEQLPVLKQSLADETTLADNRAKVLDSSQALVLDLTKQVSGLNLQLTDSTNACKLQVAAVKKSRWKYFKMGAITGFVGGLFVGHKL
jgi:hypothetical protein